MNRIVLLTTLALGMLSFCGCRTTPPGSELSREDRRATAATPEGVPGKTDRRSQAGGAKDTTNFPQAFDNGLAEAKVQMLVLKTLDEADVRRAERMLQDQIFLNLSFLPVWSQRFRPTPEQQNQAEALAREVLNYCCDHQEGLDLRYPSTQWGLNALSKLLRDKDDLARLKGLLDRLNQGPGGAASK